MKLKNVRVGQTVQVKTTFNNPYFTFERESQGRVGTVYNIEPLDYDGNLTVQLAFPDGDLDWGNHTDIKLLEDVD